MMDYRCLHLLIALFFCVIATAQNRQPQFTRLDTLFGSNTPHRSWWDVQRYDLEVTPDFATKSLSGKTTITFTVLAGRQSEYLQVDLQKPMQIDSIYHNGKPLVENSISPTYKEGNHWFLPLPQATAGTTHTLTVVYHGKPKEATNPPWEGGWVWTRDRLGRPWMSVACEDDGASLWYPCKDLWSDEPDKGASLTVHVPSELTAVANGRLKNKTVVNGKASYRWEVTSPINSYNIVPYIGYYTSWSDTLSGEKGALDLTYRVLDYEIEKAKKQFAQVKPTLRAFEYWFGPYPFYRDGYQLVQAPYLGMEHQSAVAYGNGFENGYLGDDLSRTGWGLKWDYIIVHETGHEWFGNSITAKDVADMWVHEAFTDYSETLFTERYYGKKAGNEYTQGLRKQILNDRPVIGSYGVRQEGSGDMYFKGANIIHTLRQVIDNDDTFRKILRGLNKDFYHQTVTSKQVEDYISAQSGKNLRTFFNQYLRTTQVPILEFKLAPGSVQYRWSNTIANFDMPVKLTSGRWLTPSATWQSVKLKGGETFRIDGNFYVNLKKL